MVTQRRNKIAEMMKEWESDPTTLYDDSDSALDETGLIRLMPGLTEYEKKDARVLAKYFWRGLVLVTGPPRSGKDLFVKSTCWKFKKYFGRHVLLDDRPRSLFGPYIPFNEQVLKQEIKITDAIAKGKIKESVKDVEFCQEYTESFKTWMQSSGTSLLKRGVLGLTEYQPYMDKRKPMARMNIIMGNMNRLWGHLGITIFGIAQKAEDLDEFRCLPYVTTEVRCTWMGHDTTRANIYRCKYVTAKEALQMSDDKPFPYEVNGGKLRDNLYTVDSDGNKTYKRYFDLFNSTNTLAIGGTKI